MKLSFFCTLIFLFFHAQANAQDYNKLNRERNLVGSPKKDLVIYNADTGVIHEDFGKKKQGRKIRTLFVLPRHSGGPSAFQFTADDIKETSMTLNSGVSNIELTAKGFEITYNSKDKEGAIDDYITIKTSKGDIRLRLTGEILPKATTED